MIQVFHDNRLANACIASTSREIRHLDIGLGAPHAEWMFEHSSRIQKRESARDYPADYRNGSLRQLEDRIRGGTD